MAFLSVLGMRVSHWCMLGLTILLLLCEIAISQLCKSLIVMVDGFHTLLVLMHMALPPPQKATVKPPFSSLCSPASAPHSLPSVAAFMPESPVKGGPDSQVDQPVDTHTPWSPAASLKRPNCGLSFSDSRIPVVGVFISALLLASLCVSYFLEIVSFILEPHPVKHPLLPVVVGAVSLLLKALVLGLNRDRLQDGRWQKGWEPHLEVNHEVLAEEDSRGRTECEDTGQSEGLSVACDPPHVGALVLRNPGASSVPDADSEILQKLAEVLCEGESGAADFKLAGSKNHQITLSEPSACESSRPPETPAQSSQWSSCLLSFALFVQGVFTAFLALTNGLATLLMAPQLPHGSAARGVLVYLDPALSLLAVLTLIATAMPQVYRYGLLLLQASPAHICATDVGRRIASVPGVQAVHDLHIWHLTDSLVVASVHVHCYAELPVHRCADVMSGVTKVLQNVGVSCCTVQPEFSSSCGPSSDGGEDGSPVIHRQDPCMPPLPTCSLACGKACAGSMCCSPPEDDSQRPPTPPAGETREEPQTLVIQNTFL
ncbi:unnamed protein product [Menidia menidia]|uniref:(Atlantic silverside) hypothetical protein n=1 Tax=Menidia menidia TaxID=238744 RepID=A0A8S4BV11_9TELE|nr:unnamed protein product [Menidia menidia]